MASSKDYLDYVLELLREIDGITYKKMMGEYILHKDGVIFGGIYDNRFLVKKVESLQDYGFDEQIPYPKGKPMLMIDIEDPERLKELIETIYLDLR
jgi:TfoX/Sxy family transcriptional regulator of competence genes